MKTTQSRLIESNMIKAPQRQMWQSNSRTSSQLFNRDEESKAVDVFKKIDENFMTIQSAPESNNSEQVHKAIQIQSAPEVIEVPKVIDQVVLKRLKIKCEWAEIDVESKNFQGTGSIAK